MYTATIKNVASAKNGAPSIYCESKSGNIYKLKQQVPLQQHARLISQIRSAKVINIQHWIKIKEGEFKAKPAKAQAPRPEYKEVVVKNQAARIKELQAQVTALKNQLGDAEAAIDNLKFERDSNPVDAPSMAEIAADCAKIRRADAAKKGWETRRRNAEDIAHACKMHEFEQSGDEAGAIAYLDARIAQQVAS
jgi:hypothetical protein